MDDLNAELAMAELERTWAARRSELSQRLDAAVQGAIVGVLDAAGQLRSAMEQEAASALERVRRERVAIAQEVAQLRAEHAGLGAEIAAARQRAELEAAETRRAARAEGEALLRDAERRRVELIDEIARLEQQLAQVSSGIQALLQEQIGRARAGVPGAEQLWTLAAGPGQPGAAEAARPATSPPPRAVASPAPPAPPAIAQPRPSFASEPAIDPAASPGPTPPAAEVGPPELSLDQGGTGLEVLDEGELFDLAASAAGERSLEDELAELEIDAALAPLPAGADALVALGLDEPEAERGEPEPADAPTAEEATDEEATAGLDAELAALDLELALDPMELVAPLAAHGEAPEPTTAEDARSALLASLRGFGLTPEEAQQEEAYSARPAAGAPAAPGVPPAEASGSAAWRALDDDRPASGATAAPDLAPARAAAPTRASQPAGRETHRAAAAGEPREGGTVRLEVAVTGTPSFARALELQRGIQRMEGVKQVQALQFERGTLVLSVEHEAGLDLADAMQALPNKLELIDQSASRVELRFPGGKQGA